MPGTATRTLLILTVGACGMAALLALVPAAGHDQLWLLLAAQRMLAAHSANPYGVTVFESNPPLAIWLSALVVASARLLPLPLTVLFKLATTLVVVLQGWICSRLLRRLRPELTAANLWSLAFAFILIFGVVPARDFGQRDHILLLLLLPYLLAAALQLAGRPLPAAARILITFTAATGIALKPHQALIPIAIELTVLFAPSFGLHRKNAARLLEPAIFLLTALAYYVAIRRLAPTYLTDILPVLRDTYWAFGHLTLVQLLLAAFQLLILAFLTFLRFGFRVARHPEAIRPIVSILLAGGTAALIAYLLQGTGWYYQQLPALSLFALAFAFQLIDLTNRKPIPAPRWLPVAAAALVVLALCLTFRASDFRQSSPDPSLFAGLPAEAPVATLTTSVDDTVEPAFLYHLTLAQRSPHLWMLPAILRNQSGPTPQHIIPPERLAALAALQRRFMLEDLNRWHPELILVERCQDPAVHCQVLEDRHDDLLAFFLRDPAFAALFARYRYQRSAGPYDAYLRARN